MYQKETYQVKIAGLITLFAILSTLMCQQKISHEVPDHTLVGSWIDMALYVTQYTPGNSPTYAARVLGYIGLGMYESVVPTAQSHQSLVDQLNGLAKHGWSQPQQSIHAPISFNAATARLMQHLYLQTSDQNKSRIDSLRDSWHSILSQGLNNRVVRNSAAFGEWVADSIFAWSKTDGGHRGYLRNFDKEWEHPEHPGSWKPPLYAQSFSHHPLHPHWGKNRTFLEAHMALPLPEMIPYDTTPGSPYYEQFMAVYQQDLVLTQEQKEIAIWWGDDPDDTFTPPGHSFYLAGLVIRAKQLPLIEAVETLARVGIAVADAFIKCWEWKYHFFSERPNTFVPQFIDQQWESFWPDPPFPAFPSGHAIQAAACATSLESLFGPTFSFIDSSHVGRERDEIRDVDFVARPFETFWGVAQETADSRFFGGIHTEQDNQVGLDQGKAIAERVSKLSWKR